MPVTTTYPGVYIEEQHSLSLSVSASPTAVPVFAIGADDLFKTTTRISSWMDYQRRREEGASGAAGSTLLDDCMRTYFENGGGYCYLVPVALLTDAVPKLIDATTLVAAGQDVSAAVAYLCADGRSLFAILDGPTSDISEAPPTETYGATAHAAVYYPWLQAKWSDNPIPPSAAMAGIYCKNDVTRGVWKAPANITLAGGVLPRYPVTDDLQSQYTKTNAINMIRVFNDGVATVWGARTRLDNDSWRYISVRRLFNSVERDVQAAMQAAMFEPNTQPTWESARASISNYLYGLYRQGALAGATESEAYFVQVGKDVTMTQDQIDQGQMIVKIGLAAVRPAEFIILQFTQDMAE